MSRTQCMAARIAAFVGLAVTSACAHTNERDVDFTVDEEWTNTLQRYLEQQGYQEQASAEHIAMVIAGTAMDLEHCYEMGHTKRLSGQGETHDTAHAPVSEVHEAPRQVQKLAEQPGAAGEANTARPPAADPQAGTTGVRWVGEAQPTHANLIFTIDEFGNATNVRVVGATERICSCVEDIARRYQFNPPRAGPVQVSIPAVPPSDPAWPLLLKQVAPQ